VVWFAGGCGVLLKIGVVMSLKWHLSYQQKTLCTLRHCTVSLIRDAFERRPPSGTSL